MNRVKWLSLGMCFVFSPFCFAQLCPSVETIQHQGFAGWKALDIDEGTPLPAQRLKQFTAHIQQFALAEWDKKNGRVHCYYRDNNGSNLDAYLSKAKLVPDNSSNLWYPVSGSIQCAAGLNKCQFKSLTPDNQFATNDGEQGT